MKTYQIIKFQDGNFTLDVNVSPDEDTVWLTKDEMAVLFDRDRTVISRHLKKIFDEKELLQNQVSAKNARTGPDGKTYIVEFYNLDVIISVGYRVKSQRGVIFRKWATGVLKHYMLRGYAISDSRCLECKNSILELQNKILEIQIAQEKELQNLPMFFTAGDQLKAFLGIQRFL